MPGLFIAAIHNGELANSPAAIVVSQVEALFPGSRVQEVSQQQGFEDLSDLVALREWSSRQWVLERRWRNYLGRASRLRGLLARIGKQLWRVRVAYQAAFRDRAWRIRQVEAAVSRKHQAAWKDFLASDLDLVLLLESDATWTPESAAGLSTAVELLTCKSPGYVNLAGGLSARELSIAHLRPSVSGAAPPGFLRYLPPVTNTSCAYLINRPMAELLLNQCRTHPTSSALGIDWLVNATFLEAQETRIEIECWHADPPVLIHGSTTGVTKSWHPDR